MTRTRERVLPTRRMHGTMARIALLAALSVAMVGTACAAASDMPTAVVVDHTHTSPPRGRALGLLPTACNLANTSNQAIFAASRKYAHDNRACQTLYDACLANTSADRPPCEASCVADQNEFGKACIDAGGHFCTVSIEATPSLETQGFRLAELMCLPPSCEESQLLGVKEWLSAVSCQRLPQCTVNVQCSYGDSVLDIVLAVVATVVALGLCAAVCCYMRSKVAGRYYDDDQRRPEPTFELLDNHFDDDDL